MAEMFEFIEPERRMTREELMRWIINNNYSYYLEEYINNTDYNIYRMDEETLYDRVRSIIYDEVYYEDTYNDWIAEQ